MKAFEFRLERIAEYRRQEAEVAQSRLQTLLADRARLDAQTLALETRSNEAKISVFAQAGVTGEELSGLSRFQDHVARASKQLDLKKLELNASIEKARAVLLETERRVKLLDRLRERKLHEWQTASNRELEAIAADSHLARLAAGKAAARSRA